MDSLAIRALCMEWNALFERARIEKIHQPNDRDLVLTLRTRTQTSRVILSAHRAHARAHMLSQGRPANPEDPPMFCMLLRKRLEAGRVIAVRQQGWDRVMEWEIESTDEIGDTVRFVLVHEIMGKYSNIIVAEADQRGRPGRIVDSIVHVTRDMSRVRQVLPGLPYASAPPQHKLASDDVSGAEIEALGLDGLTPKQQQLSLSRRVEGIGPVSAREILYRAHAPEAPYAVAVADTLRNLVAGVLSSAESPSVALDDLGVPIQAAPFALTSYEHHRDAKTLGEAIESVHVAMAGRIEWSVMATDIEQIVANHLDRLRGKRQKLLEQQAESMGHDVYRVKGELLTAYHYLVEKGASYVELPNFYDEEQGLGIDLDPARSAIENAQRYFKQASKKKRAIPLVQSELAQTDGDMAYLEGVAAHLEDATAEHLRHLRSELEQQGFATPARKPRKSKSSKGKAHNGPTFGVPDSYLSSDGMVIRVGRNNAQNDKLTLRTSQANDVWLHVKDLPGSHVVISAKSGQVVSDTSLQEAALLAAYFSKGKSSANVGVDYTLIKHVWKPNGARPGHVLYDHQKTLFVTPDRVHLDEIMARKQPTKQPF